MGKDTKISWCNHTFNPWEGCAKVSPGCANCYAAERDRRWHGGAHWGKEAPRFLHTDSYWRQPIKWAREAIAAGERHRVFCASLADVCEDRRDLDDHRFRLWRLIRDTWHSLDWLLLTKRIENAARLIPHDVLPLIWLGVTAEDQKRADERIPKLLATPAAVRFVSCEPLLERVDLRIKTRPLTAALTVGAINANETARMLRGQPPREQPPGLVEAYAAREVARRGIDWVIAGAESGAGARPMREEWVRDLRDQCAVTGVRFFYKQKLDGGRKVGLPPLDGRTWMQIPEVRRG